jgi:hypothetical protein
MVANRPPPVPKKTSSTSSIVPTEIKLDQRFVS